MDWQSQFEMFMPHGMCLLWRPELMSLHIISDAMIAISYFAIPVFIYRFVRGRDDLKKRHLALAGLFAAFITLCGLTHVVSIVVLWIPIYIIEGWLKLATALVSAATAGWLAAHLADIMKLPSISAMQLEIAARLKSESELRLAQHGLDQSLALLRTVIEVVPGLIYAKDQSGRLLLANQNTLELIGKPWNEVEGRRDNEILSDPQQADTVMANDRRVIATNLTQEIDEIIDHRLRGARLYQSTKVPFSNPEGAVEGLVGFSIDITDRKRIAKEELHVSRRTAMGDMAAAIAHEINQPLAAVSMYLNGSLTLLERDDYKGPLIKSLKTAQEQCTRAGEIIRRVRSFVSGGDDVKCARNAVLLVDEACALALIGSRHSGINITIEHESRDVLVMVDQVQIEQVVVNLVRNAMDALGSGKNRVLRVASGYAASGGAMISVSDNGPGISAEVADRLFEPFVSTKGLRGMGVGLSICRTIVEGHGGKIWFDTSVDTGTTFCFTLPGPSERLAA